VTVFVPTDDDAPSTMTPRPADSSMADLAVVPFGARQPDEAPRPPDEETEQNLAAERIADSIPAPPLYNPYHHFGTRNRITRIGRSHNSRHVLHRGADGDR
jgi:hypothetical protein